MTALAILLAGYSVFGAVVIALTHFRCDQYQDQQTARAMGLLLLAALGCLQFAHFVWLYLDWNWVAAIPYRIALFIVAPAFFLFSELLLRTQAVPMVRPVMLGHMAPIMAAPTLPEGIALPAAFTVGAGYLLWLARTLHALRHERANFHLEMRLLGIVFAIAVGVSVLGMAQAALPDKLFYSLYAMAIGMAFFLVQTTLGLRPRLSVELRETAQAVYASSTLNNVDCGAVLARLDTLMATERLYIDPTLNLSGLAGCLGLSSHQLSELLNARLGKGFSRYLREQRVAAAKAMLCAEPSASILSVGLSVGFTSQSNFYEAFREIEGMTPGRFRKLHVPGRPVPSPV